MKTEKIIGVDFGATNIRGGIVFDSKITSIQSIAINKSGSIDDVLKDLFFIIDQLFEKDITAIGIGVPSVVDVENGIVYDVQYIPSWKEVHLKKIIEDRYQVPVIVNNDANCFSTGEFYFGKGIGSNHMIGLTIGTGLGAGIIINKKLFAGSNCGAGEIGMVDYLDHCYEYYASGQFFENVYHTNGKEVFERAKNGDPIALKWYAELGTHLGNAIKLIQYAYDIPLIVLGGSVRMAYPFFKDNMWKRIHTLAYSKSVEKLVIEVSTLQNAAILGAAALYYDKNL